MRNGPPTCSLSPMEGFEEGVLWVFASTKSSAAFPKAHVFSWKLTGQPAGFQETGAKSSAEFPKAGF